MISRVCLLLAAAAAVARAQTASCNPLLQSSCPADPALATTFAEDFKVNSTYFEPFAHPERIEYNDDGAKLTLAQRYDNPSLKSNFYIMFGRLEVQLKAAPGQGVVSSFYLQSDDLDEIDLEWIGSDTTEVQTNYFSKGNTTTYTRGEFHGVYEPQSEFHNYTIDWTQDALSFYIDGTLVRTIDSDNPDGYPQSPMFVVTGIWAGGDPSNAAGTIEWAGGLTNYTDAPFSMYVKSMIISDYSTGSEYIYGDTSGDWSSIEAVDGEVNGRYDEGIEQFSALSMGGATSSISASSSGTSSSSDNVSSTSSKHMTRSTSGSKTSYQSSLATRSEKSSSLSTTSNTSSGTSSITTTVVDYSKNTTSSSGSNTNSTTSGDDTGALDNSSAASTLRELSSFGFGSIGLNAFVLSTVMSFALLLAL